MSYLDLANSRLSLNETQNALKKAQYDHTRVLRQTFRQEANVLFFDHPALKSFSWLQATDSECSYEFFVGKYDVKLNDTEYDELTPELQQSFKDVAEFLEEFGDDDLMVVFGDHVKITVESRSISVTFHDAEQIPSPV